MRGREAILDALRRNPAGVGFSDLCRIGDRYFGEPRQEGTSHRVYRTPRPGSPGVNIQNDKGMAQVLKKWLSYRERSILERPLAPEEVQHFTDTARRIAAILSSVSSDNPKRESTSTGS